MLWILSLVACDYYTGNWIYSPLEGPGMEIGGELLVEPQDDAQWIAASTHLYVSGGEGMKLFSENMEAMQETLDAKPEGLIAYSLGQELIGREYKTLTVWESEEAMYSFVMSPAHLQAMADGGDIANPDKVSTSYSWEISPEELPLDWKQVNEIMEESGVQAIY
jgi:heme-degrading monooxygenase HmoA